MRRRLAGRTARRGPAGQCCRYCRQHCTRLPLWAVQPARSALRVATTEATLPFRG